VIDFNLLHEKLLCQSKPIKVLHREIKINGVIKMARPHMDFFFFFCKTIISQQISEKAAESIWKKFCESNTVSMWDESYNQTTRTIKYFKTLSNLNKKIKKIGISSQKSSYITSMYKRIKNNEFNINKLTKKKETMIREELLKFNGIGNWTCDMILIFFLSKLDILPLGDLIIKKTCKKICELEKKEINFSEIFKPYQTVLSLHLWKMAKRVL